MTTHPRALQAVTPPQPPQAVTSMDTEEVKRRFMELMELALMGMSQTTTGDTQGMIAAMGPLFLMGMQEVNPLTLTKLLGCLLEIVRAALNLGYSQADYNAIMEPLVREFITLQGEL